MSISRPILLLLVLSCLSLVGLAYSGMLVSQAQRQRRRLGERFQMVTAPHLRVHRLEMSAFLRPTRTEGLSLVDRLARLFHIDTEKLDLYPLRWWLVLLITLGVADVGRVLARMVVGDLLALLAMPPLWVLLSRSFFNWAENRQRDKLLSQFPDALAMIVRSVRVGIPVMEAMRAVSRELPEPTGPEFDRLVNQVAVGGALEDAIMEMARRSGLPEYRFFATAIALQNQTGGKLSDTLESLADVIRKRMALKSKAKAMTSEARASIMVLAGMPVLTGAGLWALNPKYMNILFETSSGQKAFGAAVLSLCVGLFVMRTIIRRTLR